MKLSVSLAPLVVANVTASEVAWEGTLLRSVWLKIPSAKLLAHLTIVGSPEPGSPGVGFGPLSKWQLTPHVLAPDALSSRPAPLAPVFRESDGTLRPQQLPGGYEIKSAVRLWCARLTFQPAEFVYVDDNGDEITTDGQGRVVVGCTIEPAPEVCLTEAEFSALVGQCELWMDGPPAELTV